MKIKDIKSLTKDSLKYFNLGDYTNDELSDEILKITEEVENLNEYEIINLKNDLNQKLEFSDLGKKVLLAIGGVLILFNIFYIVSEMLFCFTIFRLLECVGKFAFVLLLVYFMYEGINKYNVWLQKCEVILDTYEKTNC